MSTSPSPTIVITGFGVVSSIGVGKQATLRALQSDASGIRHLRYLDTVHQDLPVGEVQLSDDELKQALGRATDEVVPRTSLLGQLALREALADAHLSEADIRQADLISGTTVGGMDRREALYETEATCDARHARIAIFNCADSTAMIADPCGQFASLTTISTACSSATNAIITGADRLRTGEASLVVAGGAESLSKFHLNGFNTLMILDAEPCKPFDLDRHGLNLGEGAAFLVLETLESAKARGVRPLAVLAGYANACDAFHQTASSPDGEGAYLAMSQALSMAGLRPADIDYINAHGTGTPNNDESEGHAIRRIFGNDYPPVSSTKAFTGHTTSASGSIEAAICLLAMAHRFVPANLNFRTPMPDGITPCARRRDNCVLRHVLSNAFGFGGNDSALIFSAIKEG